MRNGLNMETLKLKMNRNKTIVVFWKKIIQIENEGLEETQEYIYLSQVVRSSKVHGNEIKRQ